MFQTDGYAHTCTLVVRFDIIVISRPTSNNLKDQLILTVDKCLLPLILRFSALVDSLPPVYPYTLMQAFPKQSTFGSRSGIPVCIEFDR